MNLVGRSRCRSHFTIMDSYNVTELEQELRGKAHELFKTGNYQKITLSGETPWGCSVTYDSSGDEESPLNKVKAHDKEMEELNYALQKYQRAPVVRPGGLAYGRARSV